MFLYEIGLDKPDIEILKNELTGKYYLLCRNVPAELFPLPNQKITKEELKNSSSKIDAKILEEYDPL